jgi:hypothetical protein
MFASETIHPPTVLRLLRGIDGLPEDATGALVIASSGGPEGTILVEDRRVCWAAASEMGNRLTSLLRAQGGVTAPAEAFEEVFEECHRRGKPLGETLVRRGLVSRDGLKCALLEHTAEAIARLTARSHLILGWTPSRVKRYDAQFTFTSVELLCAVGAIGLEDTAADAALKLVEVTPEGSVGAAFLADGCHTLPMAQVAADGWACESLVDLGDWARVALGERAPGESGSVLGSDTVHSLKRAWRSGELVLVRWSGDVEPEPLSPSEPFDLERATVLTR